MVEAVSAHKADGAWLEPSAGDGAFVYAIAAMGVAREFVAALEVEPSAPVSQHPWVQGGVDFFSWIDTEKRVFDYVVGNPPYLKLSRLSSQAAALARSVERPVGFPPVSGTANLWYAFVVGSLARLAPGGAVAWVLPAAYSYADYARPLRALVASAFSDTLVLRSRRPLCEGVDEATVVLACRGWNRPTNSHTERWVDGVAEATAVLKGWQSVPQGPGRKEDRNPGTEEDLYTLSERAVVRIGAVTGDTSFFLLNRAEQERHSLPAHSFVPALGKARHLVESRMSVATWRGLLAAGERVLLFRPTDADLLDPHVRRYLSLRPDDGGCHRDAFKVRTRSVWHRTPLPDGVHAFMSADVGNGALSVGADADGLTATNSLFVLTFRGDQCRQARAAILLGLMSTRVHHEIQQGARVYAGGLRKLEPTQIMDLRLPSWGCPLGAQDAHRSAVALFRAGERSTARSIADEFFSASRRKAAVSRFHPAAPPQT